MALVKSVLVLALQAAFDGESDKDVNPAEARQRQAEKIATAIDNYIKSGTVTVTVTTAGTATAQAGGGTGSIS